MKEDLARGREVVPLVVRKPKFGYFLISSGHEREALKAHGHPGLSINGGLVLLLAGIWMMPAISNVPLSNWVRAALLVALTVWGMLRLLRRR